MEQDIFLKIYIGAKKMINLDYNYQLINWEKTGKRKTELCLEQNSLSRAHNREWISSVQVRTD